MANVTVTVRVVDDQPSPQPVDNVLVRVFDDDADVYITEGITGTVTPGEVAFTLFGNVAGVAYTLFLSKSGVSFPPAPQKSITVHDPPAPSNLFQFVAHAGLDDVVVIFSVKDDQPAPQPLENVKVRLFDESDIYLTELDTDAAGEASLLLEGAASPGKAYIVRLVPPTGYLIQNGATQTVAVLDPVAPPETNTFDFVAVEQPTAEVSPDPDMCRLSGYFTDPSKRPIKNLSLIFHPREGYPDYPYPLGGAPYSGQPSVVGGRIIASERRVNTDKDGYVNFDLPRKGVFDVYIQGMDAPDNLLLAAIYVPDVAGIEIEKVLYPYVEAIVFDTAAIAVAVDGTTTVGLTIYTSNLLEASQLILGGMLTFELDDDSVAEILVEDGNLVVTGLSAGVANLSVTRKTGTVPPYSPELADLQVLPSAPVITVS